MIHSLASAATAILENRKILLRIAIDDSSSLPAFNATWGAFESVGQFSQSLG